MNTKQPTPLLPPTPAPLPLPSFLFLIILVMKQYSWHMTHLRQAWTANQPTCLHPCTPMPLPTPIAMLCKGFYFYFSIILATKQYSWHTTCLWQAWTANQLTCLHPCTPICPSPCSVKVFYFISQSFWQQNSTATTWHPCNRHERPTNQLTYTLVPPYLSPHLSPCSVKVFF